MRVFHQLAATASSNPWLTATLAVAFALRLATIGWGIPITPHSGFYHGDEAKSYSSTIQFPEQYLGSESFLYGTAVQYGIGLVLLPVKVVMVGLLDVPATYSLTAIVFFRFCNVLMGTASVYLVFALGRRLIGAQAGLVAAMLLSVALYPALHSCLTTLDVPMSFLLLGTALACLRCSETPAMRTYFCAGLVAGVLLGTKVTGFLFVGCSFLWLAVVLNTSQGSGESALSVSDRTALLLVFSMAAAGVFALTTPHVVLDFGAFWEFMMHQKSNWYDKAPSSLGGILAAWFDGTSSAAGIPVTLTFPVGLVLLARTKARETLLLGLWVGVNYLFWRGFLPPRFLIVVVPVLCLLSAALWNRLLDAEARWVRWGSTALLAIAIGGATGKCLLGVTQRWMDPRTAAARYIAQHVPPGSSIGIATDHNGHWMHHNWRYPRIDERILRLTPFLERPEFVVVTSFELDRMQDAIGSGKLLAGNRWNPEFNREWYLSEPPSPEIFTFYEGLLAGETYVPVTEFTAGPRLRIDNAPDVFLFRRRSPSVRAADGH